MSCELTNIGGNNCPYLQGFEHVAARYLIYHSTATHHGTLVTLWHNPGEGTGIETFVFGNQSHLVQSEVKIAFIITHKEITLWVCLELSRRKYLLGHIMYTTDKYGNCEFTVTKLHGGSLYHHCMVIDTGQ